MNPSEKRRGGAAAPGSSSGHVHRAGPHHPVPAGGRPGGAGLGKGRDDGGKDASEAAAGTTTTTTTTMPTMPPRVAVSNASEEIYDAGGAGGATSAAGSPGADTDRPDRERDHEGLNHIREGKDKERDGAGPAGGAQRTNSVRSTAGNAVGWGAATSSKSKQRELATVTAQLHEREKRVAHLEKDMAIMEREFQRQLDKLSQNESETTTFWQTKYSQLNQQFLRTDTELRLLRNEVEAREEEREELRQGWEVLRRELKERDDDIRGLRGQVRGLKEFVSTSTRTDGQTSDEVFGDGMTRLGNGLQNWVIVNFRKAKMGKQNEHQHISSATTCWGLG